MNKIVSDCLEFVRPVKVSTEKVDLKALLEESLANSLSTVNQRRDSNREGLIIRLPAVSLDYNQMKQVFVNILH